MATIRDVAKLAGVSCSTVSRAISGSTVVDNETRKRVLQAANKLHYVPTQMARGLKQRRSKMIQLLVPTITNPFFPKLIDCFSKEIDQYGYATFLSVSKSSKSEELKCVQRAREFSADGIILVASTDDCDHITAMKNYGIPMILVNRSWDLGLPSVTNDNFFGAYKAIEHLILHGHRKIVYIMSDISVQHIRERYAGCLQAFQDYGIGPEGGVYIQAQSTKEVYDKTCRVLEENPDVTAFFVASDWMAMGVYSGVIRGGYSIPKDISVMGFDDVEDSAYMIPPLSTWHHPIETIAQIAVKKLIDHIEGRETDWDGKIVIHGRLIERNSVCQIGPAPEKIKKESGPLDPINFSEYV